MPVRHSRRTVRRRALQHTATHCNTLQHTAKHCKLASMHACHSIGTETDLVIHTIDLVTSTQKGEGGGGGGGVVATLILVVIKRLFDTRVHICVHECMQLHTVRTCKHTYNHAKIQIHCTYMLDAYICMHTCKITCKITQREINKQTRHHIRTHSQKYMRTHVHTYTP